MRYWTGNSRPALVGLLGPVYARTEEEGRALVREILRAPADILPDEGAGLLRIRLHGLANPRSNEAVKYLCEQLNELDSQRKCSS